MEKTNNNIAGYHLVSRRVISTPSDVQRVYRCPKKTFILPQNIMLQFDIYYHRNYYATWMLLEKLCYMKTNINFRDPGTDPRQSVGSRIFFYSMTIMPKIFIEDSSNLEHPKNVKSINNTTSSHLVSCREISRGDFSPSRGEKRCVLKYTCSWKSKM